MFRTTHEEIAIREALVSQWAEALFVRKRRIRRERVAKLQGAEREAQRQRTNRENRQASGADRSIDSICGLPGSAERIESLRTFYASQVNPFGDEFCESSPFILEND